jgi:hypothetical protein
MQAFAPVSVVLLTALASYADGQEQNQPDAQHVLTLGVIRQEKS